MLSVSTLLRLRVFGRTGIDYVKTVPAFLTCCSPSRCHVEIRMLDAAQERSIVQ